MLLGLECLSTTQKTRRHCGPKGETSWSKSLTGLPQDRSCSRCVLMEVSSDRFGTAGDAAAEKKKASKPISSQKAASEVIMTGGTKVACGMDMESTKVAYDIDVLCRKNWLHCSRKRRPELLASMSLW